REQAASCQRVLGAWGNIAQQYATKRYRSNLINWGIIPFTTEQDKEISNKDFIFVPNIKNSILNENDTIKAYIVNKDLKEITLSIGHLTKEERQILIKGSLINYNKSLNN
ncbi:MAG: hydratase, partial [Tissierellia bacterium]|nr:hydratase [Tissierellia bacterium]